MTPEEQAIVKKKLGEVAEILYKNTPSKKLSTFERVELNVREHLLETVAPKVGNFFSISRRKQSRKRHKDIDKNKNCPQHTASASEQLSITKAEDY